MAYERRIGHDLPGKSVYVQYHEPSDVKGGHWTLKGNKEPSTRGITRNNCLFNVIAEQTGICPDELRGEVVRTLSDDMHFSMLANGAIYN